MSDAEHQALYHAEDLVTAFRVHYQHYETAVRQALTQPTDYFPLVRLNDDLAEFMAIIFMCQFGGVLNPQERDVLELNVAQMQADVHLRYDEVIEASHHGRPEVVYEEQSDGPGRPRTVVDPEFLAWAYHQRTTSGLARFLGIGRTRLRELLLEHGIAPPGTAPFIDEDDDFPDLTPGLDDEEDIDVDNNDFLDPQEPIPEQLPEELRSRQVPGYLSNITDEELDGLLLALRTQLRRAGISMLDGMLRNLGHQVPRQRIRQSLLRIDPVRRIFERITIRRRGYTVPGPNALWHHDGQHGLIRWGIVIHGFIDGYSRLITAIRASGNNYAATVLEVFLCAARMFGVPARCRGDHGTENLFVAEWMERHYGTNWGSYIWGRSVHNVRIERLWVDVTVQVGSTWADLFHMLELRHGLNINNPLHIWLLHHLFLPTVNRDLTAFAQAWNSHRLNIRHGTNRSPINMFVFDSLVHGVRGYQLELTGDELEVYGLDWDALNEERILASHAMNNPIGEGAASWVGQQGPPPQLNEVWVEQPETVLSEEEMVALDRVVGEWLWSSSPDHVASAWCEGLAFCRLICGDMF